jgi:hypothetical protein
MKNEEENKEWPPWLSVAIWSTVLLFSVADFFQKSPLSLPWILRYGALFFSLFANMLPKAKRLRWMLLGAALGMLFASILVDISLKSDVRFLFQ